MTRILVAALFLLCHVVWAQPSSVSLKGVVMKQGGSFPLSGVVVSLAGSPSLSAVTNDMGSFFITSTAVVRNNPKSIRCPDIRVGAGSITIFHTATDPVTRAELFSANGMRLASVSAPQSDGGMSPLSMKVTDMGCAVYILRILTECPGTASFERFTGTARLYKIPFERFKRAKVFVVAQLHG